MAARSKPGIAKRGPRSSKVVPITPRELRQIPVVQKPDRLRDKAADWLESTILRWLRRA